MQDISILDRESALKSLGGDGSLYQELVELYLRDSPRVLEGLFSHWEDDEILRSSAHKLKGMGALIGAQRLSNLCQSLEEGGKEACSQEFLKEVFSLTQGQLMQLLTEKTRIFDQ